MRQNYLDRAMKARDPRFAKIATKLGYRRRDMVAAPAAVMVDELADARAEYERVVGRKPYWGWDVAALRAKIAEAG